MYTVSMLVITAPRRLRQEDFKFKGHLVKANLGNFMRPLLVRGQALSLTGSRSQTQHLFLLVWLWQTEQNPGLFPRILRS